MERISLLDSLRQTWLKLPWPVVRECGPAAQTLAALWLEASKARKTFRGQKHLAGRGRVEPRTYRRHLRTLIEGGWIVNCGRQNTQAGKPRRTATIKLTAQTESAFREVDGRFGILPWWACCRIGTAGRLSWGCRALLAIIMARLASLRHIGTENDIVFPDYPDKTEVLDWIADVESILCEDVAERFRLSLRYLQGLTGLRRDAIIKAKDTLHHHRIINWSGGDGRADTLPPNWRFAVVETPAGNGRVFLDFGELIDEPDEPYDGP